MFIDNLNGFVNPNFKHWLFYKKFNHQYTTLYFEKKLKEKFRTIIEKYRFTIEYGNTYSGVAYFILKDRSSSFSI